MFHLGLNRPHAGHLWPVVVVAQGGVDRQVGEEVSDGAGHVPDHLDHRLCGQVFNVDVRWTVTAKQQIQDQPDVLLKPCRPPLPPPSPLDWTGSLGTKTRNNKQPHFHLTDRLTDRHQDQLSADWLHMSEVHTLKLMTGGSGFSLLTGGSGP